MSRLENKIALITGGASGIGASSVKKFLEQGAKVYCTDINQELGEKLVNDLTSDYSDKIVFIKHDVTSEQDWSAVCEQIDQNDQKLDILVHNAGIANIKNIEQDNLDDWNKMLNINVTSLFIGSQQALSLLQKSGSASIINLSSIEGLIGEPELISYTTSKAAVLNFTRSLALHCQKQGYAIRVNSIHPGFIDTPMVKDAVAKDPSAMAIVENVMQQLPMKRLGTADEIANGILFLASDESSYMTGTQLVMDGGYTAK